MVPLSKKDYIKKSWITNDIKKSSVKKHNILKAYQYQGTLEAKQKFRQQTVKIKKMVAENKKEFYNGLFFENTGQPNKKFFDYVNEVKGDD